MTTTRPVSVHRPLTGGGLAVLLIAYAPVNFTFGSVNVLAESIGRDLGAGSAGPQLVLSAYTTAFAASLLIAGRLGDRYGRRRMLTLGSAGVAMLSAATAFAPDIASLVAVRVLLGIAAGLVTPQVLATIQATSRGAARSSGLMLFAAMSGVSTVLGQVLAGLVDSALDPHLGWRAVQIVTGLIALAGLVGLRFVPDSRVSEPLAMDGFGASLLGGALLLILVPLTLGPSSGWPLWSIAGMAAGAVLLVAFWVAQRRSEARGLTPVVPPRVLRLSVIRTGLVMTVLFFLTYGAMLYELSALARARFGMGALGASMLLLGFGAVFIATSALLPRILPDAGERTMAVAGVVQAAILAAIAVLAATGNDDLGALQFALIPLGAAQALMFGPVLNTVLSRAPGWAAGVASGLFTTVQQLGLSIGVAVLGGAFWAIAGPDGARMDAALAAVFAVHAACALVFAGLARSLSRR